MVSGLNKGFDTAIVGGGLVGMGIAYGLARMGQRVVILDEGDTALRASRGNFALVWVQSKGLGMPAYAHWTIGSSEAWQNFATELTAETGVNLHFERPGGFLLCLSDAEMEARRTSLHRFRQQEGAPDYNVDLLDHAQLAKMLPGLGRDVVGGSYCPLDGHVNALKLFRALHLACERRSVRYVPGSPVTAIRQSAGGYSVTTAERTLHARKVVLAAGNANQKLAPLVGLSSPMTPAPGQILVTERTDRFLNYPIGTVRQTDEGTIMIGDSYVDAPDPAGMKLDVNFVMANRAVRMFPRLAQLKVVRSWRAVRVLPKDGFPIYDQSTSHPGVFVAGCHSGVTLAAAHALHLAPMIAAGTLDADRVAAFSARRFDVQATV